MKNSKRDLSEEKFLKMVRNLNKEQLDSIHEQLKNLSENNKKAGE